MRTQEKEDKDINYDPLAGLPHMADGGIVPDDLNIGPAPQGSDSDPSLAPQPVDASQPTAMAPKAGLPGMPPDMTADDLQKYLGQQKQAIDKYGPEQEMAVQQSLIKSRQGVLPSLARAGGGLADAIMQGVARAGPSHFQENITGEQNKVSDDVMNTMGKAQTGKMAQMQAEMKLSQEDPSSPLSKVAQNTEGPTLIQLGANPEQISKMPASLIGDLLSKKITLQDALARIQETGAYQRGMLGLKNEEVKKANRELGFKEDEEASKHWLRHPVNAMKAADRISEGSSGEPSAKTFDSVEEAESAGLPVGTRVSINGRMATIK